MKTEYSYALLLSKYKIFQTTNQNVGNELSWNYKKIKPLPAEYETSMNAKLGLRSQVKACKILCMSSLAFRQMYTQNIWAPAHWGLGEIDGLLVPPGKASNLLTNHLITV